MKVEDLISMISKYPELNNIRFNFRTPSGEIYQAEECNISQWDQSSINLTFMKSSSDGRLMRVNDIVDSIGTFANYKGMDGNNIYGNQLQSVLAKQMIRQLDPEDGWEHSSLTILKTPLLNQPGNDIITIKAEDSIQESAFGNNVLSFSKYTLKRLYDSANIVNGLKNLGFEIPESLGASNICHSQEVHFFVEQHKSESGKSSNKLRDGNLDYQVPNVLLSIPGINMSYFGSMINERKGALFFGKFSIEKIIKNMWEVVLTSAYFQNCSIISIPNIGLGVFIRGVEGEIRHRIARIYFSSLFNVIRSKESYLCYFDSIYYNPAEYGEQFDEELEKYPCLVRHFKGDSKFLAIELAKYGYRCALVNPSDPDVILGRNDIGQLYKSGHYAAEEDMAATSTACIGSKGINRVYTDEDRTFWDVLSYSC